MATPKPRNGGTKQLLAPAKQAPLVWMTLLNNMVPGLSAVLKFYRDSLGIDVTKILSAVVIAFGIYQYGQSWWATIRSWTYSYCTRSVLLFDGCGDIYEEIMAWMWNHKLLGSSVDLRLREWAAQMNQDYIKFTQANPSTHVNFAD